MPRLYSASLMLIRLSVFVFILFSLCACQKCETGDFFMTVRFYSEQGELVNPEWDRVYGEGFSSSYIQNDSLTSFPVDLSRDRTVLIFEKEGQLDTLAFRYESNLRSGGGERGYCLELMNEELLPITTFDVRSFVFESPSLGGNTQVYAVEINL